METQIVVPLACRHATLRLATRETTGFVDITASLEQLVTAAHIKFGTLCAQTRHTTTGLLVNEHEAQLLVDFRRLLARAAPPEETYAHDDLDRRPDVPQDEPRN